MALGRDHLPFFGRATLLVLETHSLHVEFGAFLMRKSFDSQADSEHPPANGDP